MKTIQLIKSVGPHGSNGIWLAFHSIESVFLMDLLDYYVEKMWKFVESVVRKNFHYFCSFVEIDSGEIFWIKAKWFIDAFTMLNRARLFSIYLSNGSKTIAKCVDQKFLFINLIQIFFQMKSINQLDFWNEKIGKFLTSHVSAHKKKYGE